MKNTILLLLFVSLLSLMYYFKESTSEEIGTHTKKISSVKTNSSHTAKVQTRQIHQKSVLNTVEVEKKSIEEDAIEVFYESKVIFEEESIDDMKLIVDHMPDVIPVGAVRMQKGMIADIKVGDTLILPSIDGNSYELKVVNRFVSDIGNVSIDGIYMENDIAYHSILTEGKNVSFVSMNTPIGTYEVELEDGRGYIYAVSDIENAKIDYNKSDVIEAPHHHDEE